MAGGCINRKLMEVGLVAFNHTANLTEQSLSVSNPTQNGSYRCTDRHMIC